MYIGEPIDVSVLLQHQSRVQASGVVVRKQITDLVQEKMRELKTRAEELHDSWNCSSRVAYRLL